jgi:hypothetical protein
VCVLTRVVRVVRVTAFRVLFIPCCRCSIVSVRVVCFKGVCIHELGKIESSTIQLKLVARWTCAHRVVELPRSAQAKRSALHCEKNSQHTHNASITHTHTALRRDFFSLIEFFKKKCYTRTAQDWCKWRAH